MKRKIALFLTVMLFITMLVPVNIFAQADKELENAINKAKATFSIPSNYTEFNYNVNTEGTKKVWYLNWYRKDGIDGGMSVSVDDRGTISSYSFYKPYDYTQKSLPKLTRQEALSKAQEFIKKVNPAAADQIKYMPDTNQYGTLGIDYYMNFIRMEKGIPFPENSISVSVNVQTGDVQSYYMNWTDDLKFPAADKVISLEAAKAAYKEKLGLRLSYSRTYGVNYNNDDVKAYAAYLPRYNGSYFIDALTGEKVSLSPYYGYGYGGKGDGMVFSTQKAAMNEAAMPPPLSPEELKAIQEVSKLISQDDAEKKARAAGELGLTSDFKLSRAGLSKSWEFKKDFFWDLSFVKESADKDNASLYTSVTVDAITGEIRGFSLGLPYNQNDAAKFDEAGAKAEVEKFLSGFMPEKSKNLEYQETGRNYPILNAEGKDAPRYFNFTYSRKVNGIPFIGNSVTIGFDAVYGKVNSLYMSWFDPEFPPVDKVVSLESIYEKMFSEIGMELQYRFKYPEASFNKMPPIQAPNSKPEPVLVYSVKQDKPLSFDANTGAIIDSTGKVFKEFKPVDYTDISGHYAEKKIAALAEYGIALEGDKFRPNDQIQQLDFLALLAKTLNYYTPVVISSDSSTKEIDELYRFLINEGIVLEGEKSPQSDVTREDGVKFIIRSLKYNKVADIKGIFNCSFKDSDKVTPELYGYVAIAQGLKIVNGNAGGYFLPKSKLTRAEGAVMIYNYLQK